MASQSIIIINSIPSFQVQGQGLGIMIIEGKHAEVGQGIFISDIQEGSAAYQVLYFQKFLMKHFTHLLLLIMKPLLQKIGKMKQIT